MPAQINNLKAHGWFKVHIDLANAFNEKDPTEAEMAEAWGEAWVELREIDGQEAASLNSSMDSGEQNRWFVDQLPKMIVEHNIEKGEGKKASKEEVAEAIVRSSTVFAYTLSEWLSSLPLARRSAASSAK